MVFEVSGINSVTSLLNDPWSSLLKDPGSSDAKTSRNKKLQDASDGKGSQEDERCRYLDTFTVFRWITAPSGNFAGGFRSHSNGLFQHADDR